MKRLDARGITHTLLVMAFILVFSIAGVGYLVASHADSKSYCVGAGNCYTPPAKASQHASICAADHCGGSTAKNYGTSKIPTYPHPGIASVQKTPPHTSEPTQRHDYDSGAASAAGASSPSSSGSSSSGGDSVASDSAPTSNYTSAPAPPRPNPEINIVVITSVGDGNDAPRLGGVPVSISREGGDEKCDNGYQHKHGLSVHTNSTRYDKNHKLVKGTAHFLGCSTGTYTIKIQARKGYKVVHASSKTFHWDDKDQTHRVQFTLASTTDTKETSKKSSSSTGSRTPSGLDGTPSYSCTSLTATKVSGMTYSFAAKGTASNGASIAGYGFYFDANDASAQQGGTASTAQHTYTKSGTYNASVTLLVSANGQSKSVTSDKCKTQVTIP